ncbi:MAG: FAD-dependent oxidoreductase [Rhodocyclaceae bacterium]|jgi:2,4-dienoyl-CoA reductase-like NADH-dependent reductase (Old Yellow Enzyme family)/thioredoxin reductase|nr:FAD-dependent oxidoreductase [Rhodocyclaceae bacterium]
MAAPHYPNLFSPFKLGTVTLRNRTVMAPMSTNLGTAEGAVTPRQIAFYRARAEGGVGMIIVEFCCVHRATGRSEHGQLSLENPGHLDGHIRLVEAIKSAGSVACLQLQHGGPGVKRELVEHGVAVGPSDIKSRHEDKLTCRALSNDEIEHLIECFGKTAELGVQAGYEAFELHGAHGYLLTCFLTPYFNHRDDAWGGDEERRLNFPRRVIQRVKQAIGDRPLLFRISAEEFTPKGLSIEDMVRIAPKLVEAGADGLHVSIGLGATSFDKIIEPMSMPEGWRIPYARRIKEAVNVPIITVGQIRWPATADKAIANGDADMVAFGRTLLADPEWANKAMRGDDAAIRPCTSCNYCVALGMDPHGHIGCAENPMTGHELDAIPDAGPQRGRLAVVIGGGPGGMAAALMLDQAGFKTELYESRATLGGGLIASAAPPFKDKFNWYQTYLKNRIAQSGVTVKLGTTVDVPALAKEKPAVVMVAIGGQAVRIPIEGGDHAIVHDAYEVLMGDDSWLPKSTELPIMVYGGGETGCETAEYLAERGHKVLLVSRSAGTQLARSAEMIYRGVLRKRLAENEMITVVEHSTILAITADGVVTLEKKDGSRSELKTSCLLVAQGRRPDTPFINALGKAGLPYVVIGDARKGGRIGDAVNGAYGAITALCAASAPVRQLAC